MDFDAPEIFAVVQAGQAGRCRGFGPLRAPYLYMRIYMNIDGHSISIEDTCIPTVQTVYIYI